VAVVSLASVLRSLKKSGAPRATPVPLACQTPAPVPSDGVEDASPGDAHVASRAGTALLVVGPTISRFAVKAQGPWNSLAGPRPAPGPLTAPSAAATMRSRNLLRSSQTGRPKHGMLFGPACQKRPRPTSSTRRGADEVVPRVRLRPAGAGVSGSPRRGKPVPQAHDLAGADGTPELFLRRTLRLLVDARLLHSVKGPRGGYRLARPAKDITLLAIVEAVDGPLPVEAPQVSEDTAFDQRLQALCENVAKAVRSVLRSVTLADLAAGKPAAKKPTRNAKGK